ncbi:MAG TPA: alpha/beta hydrolase [Acidimicrobiales bacterium]|nr:alpha/beta hydrolase [Acidimicrobiales bacterium]
MLPAVLGLTLVATTVAGCDWPAGTRYVHPVFTSVERTNGVVYRNTTTWDGQPVALRMDVYRPAGDTATDRPAVVWLFGGGWQFGTRNQLSSFADDSARRGYVGVTIDYRIRANQSPLDTFGAAMDAYDDTIAAVQFLKDHAAEYGINPDQIVTAGHSAGAINALHTVYLPGTRGPATPTVAAAVGISGLTFRQAAEPRPPTLQFHGTADPIVPLSSGQAACDATRAAGNFCHMVTYEGAGHGLPQQFPDDIKAKTADFIFEQVVLPDQLGTG